jgi:predicted HAD superfamily Cof-like phosphohydrolase
MMHNFSQIIQEIKEMNTVFERGEGSGAHRENEFSYFSQEVDELNTARQELDLIEVLDALVDIGVFTIGAAHKDGVDMQTMLNKVNSAQCVNLHAIKDAQSYATHIYALIHSVIATLTNLIDEKLVLELFHEVYLSNMSKLKDGKPIAGDLPGKFGKNKETYFRPDLKKVLLGHS